MLQLHCRVGPSGSSLFKLSEFKVDTERSCAVYFAATADMLYWIDPLLLTSGDLRVY